MRKNLRNQTKSCLGVILFTINSAQTNMGKIWTSLVTAMNCLSNVTDTFCVPFLQVC
jgi:hypothetical protein